MEFLEPADYTSPNPQIEIECRLHFAPISIEINYMAFIVGA